MSRSRWLTPLLVANSVTLSSAVAGVVAGERIFRNLCKKETAIHNIKALSAIFNEIARHHTRTLARLVVSNAQEVTLLALLKAKLTPQFLYRDWYGATGSTQIVLGTSQMDLLIRNIGFDIDDLQDKKWTLEQKTRSSTI